MALFGRRYSAQKIRCLPKALVQPTRFYPANTLYAKKRFPEILSQLTKCARRSTQFHAVERAPQRSPCLLQLQAKPNYFSMPTVWTALILLAIVPRFASAEILGWKVGGIADPGIWYPSKSVACTAQGAYHDNYHGVPSCHSWYPQSDVCHFEHNWCGGNGDLPYYPRTLNYSPKNQGGLSPGNVLYRGHKPCECRCWQQVPSGA